MALSVPLRKHELFTRSKGPDCLPWGHSPGRPGRTQLGNRRSTSPGYSNQLGLWRQEPVRVSRWAVPGPGRAAASSRRAPLLGREASEITPSARGPGPRSGGIPGEWRPELWASSPAGRHPGDTGAPSSRLTRLVWTRVNPRGEVPGRPQRPKSCRAAAGPGWRRERLLGVVFPPGGSRPPPFPGVRAACQGVRNPVPPGAAARAALPTQASPPPCQGRSKQETQDLTWRDPDFWPGFPLSR